ncbi:MULTISPECIES: sensor histidine kinase [Rhodanobacter]|uniref:sensor histidine kinase n=2 Tax=Gammaproteobacteria TaxID=1236 RepID=UPI0003FBB161|nr:MULTISPECIES: sensor histidine kinase [Rhodanobacter]KZC19866.1 histidine kinase [Rhodanobacter denitrificans]UJM94899.1 sensor histidine kinase N-terminal domain-containing protein [Rhodanobacter denitrificans]UJM98429.1 sensor histidine kinase N-terminal domain-containing protein [Rhodanobacter denitrificans]UJN22158.1 sensor histidine kinase N-terminal domain-containing protein [Rhodanobacter denitrificans]
MNRPRIRPRRPSLRRRLLLALLVPVGVLLLLDALLTYGVALTYANRVHDRDLSNDALTLATMLGNDRFDGELTPRARFLLEYDPGGHSYFTVSSARHGLLASNGQLPQPAQVPAIGARPTLYDAQLAKHALRAATVHIAMRSDPGDSLVVTVAETLHDRHQQAREILLLASVTQTLLIAGVLSLVWFGVGRGLHVLDPLTARLAARTDELTPIDGSDVPLEIRPLTQTIDALFGRLRGMLILHDRFIADAAHQLRTPLTGLSLHVEYAMANPQPEIVADALLHIQRLVRRAARTSAQLLALTRAQAPSLETGERTLLDLARFIPEAVSERVHEAIRAGVDLGYEGGGQALFVLGDAASLHDLLDNLIDNAVRYAGRGSTVTVRLAARADGGASLSVEDNGPGVPAELLPRLSERFFRAASNNEEGSGLGLAIVQRIAERHHADVVYRPGESRGLCVEVRFPAPPAILDRPA